MDDPCHSLTFYGPSQRIIYKFERHIKIKRLNLRRVRSPLIESISPQFRAPISRRRWIRRPSSYGNDQLPRTSTRHVFDVVLFSEVTRLVSAAIFKQAPLTQ